MHIIPRFEYIRVINFDSAHQSNNEILIELFASEFFARIFYGVCASDHTDAFSLSLHSCLFLVSTIRNGIIYNLMITRNSLEAKAFSSSFTWYTHFIENYSISRPTHISTMHTFIIAHSNHIRCGSWRRTNTMRLTDIVGMVEKHYNPLWLYHV